MSNENKILESLLTQAIKLAKLAALNSETVQKLKEAQMFIKKNQPDKAKTAVMSAFENLPEDTRALLGNLSQAQLRTIEQLISQMYQHPQTDQTDIQEEIDQLLNRSYQATQQGGSQVSYLYLLSALDKAGIPLEKTPRSFQKQLKSLMNSMTRQVNRRVNSSGRQTGGALPVSWAAIAGLAGMTLIAIVLVILSVLKLRRARAARAHQRIYPIDLAKELAVADDTLLYAPEHPPAWPARYGVKSQYDMARKPQQKPYVAGATYAEKPTAQQTQVSTYHPDPAQPLTPLSQYNIYTPK